MKFGIYALPDSNLDFRKMDGEWTALKSIATGNARKQWEYYSTEKGRPVNAEYIETHKHRQCQTYCRSVAKMFFGVPDDVELYGEDTKSIQSFDQKAYVASYNRANYDRVDLKIPKGKKSEWKAKAKAAGLSLTEWIVQKVERD